MAQLGTNEQANHACDPKSQTLESPATPRQRSNIELTPCDWNGPVTTQIHPNSGDAKLNARAEVAPRRPQRFAEFMVALLMVNSNSADVGDDDCWLWQSIESSAGYPEVHFCGKQYPAHRMAAALYFGPAAVAEKDVHHLCEVPLCVNPRHLVPVTAAEHAQIHRDGLAVERPPRAEPEMVNGTDVLAAVTPSSVTFRARGEVVACGTCFSPRTSLGLHPDCEVRS